MRACTSTTLLFCISAAAARPGAVSPVVGRWTLTVAGPRAPNPNARPVAVVVARSGTALGCPDGDSATSTATVRARLAEWVRQTNAGDRTGADEVWAPGMVGWFPSPSLFSDSAARAVAGVALSREPTRPRTTFEVIVDDIVASGSVVVVHDVWTETREFAAPARTVQRVIRGSELWRCQPDGRWRIARYVSAPEPWTVARRRGAP